MPPPNDNLADAIELTGASGQFTGQSNVGATSEPGEPTSGSSTATIWYKVSTPERSRVTITTVGSELDGSEFDTVLSVWWGNSVAELQATTANDDADGGYTSKVSWITEADRVYYVRVHGYSDVSDEIVVNWSVLSSRRTIFGDGDDWKVLKGVAIGPSDAIPDGPTGWEDIGFDDSAWMTLTNGAASGSTADGQELPGRAVFVGGVFDHYEYRGVHWRSLIDADHVYYARRVFTLTQDDIDAGVLVSAGVGQLGTITVNGVIWSTWNAGARVADGRTDITFPDDFVVGDNVLSLRAADRSGGADDGADLDALFWARIDVLAPPVTTRRPTVGRIGFR